MIKRLKKIKKKHSGRDASGKVVVRHQGGQQKRYTRIVDFKREKKNVPGRVIAFEYDPNRSCDVALVQYTDGDKRYILRPEGLQLNEVIMSSDDADIKIGNSILLANVPLGTIVHNIELTPGRGGQIARSAGTAAMVTAKEGSMVHIKLPSGEIRRIRSAGFATIGQLGNIDWKNRVIGKAGRKILMGIRPTVRGVAQNPRSHPHGGGEGRSPIGLKYPKTYAGRRAVGKTRRPNKYSDKQIIQRRKK